jgi:ribosomal protein S27AE
MPHATKEAFREWYQKNRESILRKGRKRAKLRRNSNLEKARDRERAYRAEHRDKIRSYRAAHYLENGDTIRARNRKWRKAHAEELRQYRLEHKAERSRAFSEWAKKHPNYFREWRIAHREHNTELARIYRAKNRTAYYERHRAWVSANIEKHHAQQNLWSAIQRGKISRPSTCEKCGKEFLVHGHHDDYSRQYDVRWLCPLCHRAAHDAHHRAIIESNAAVGPTQLRLE